MFFKKLKNYLLSFLITLLVYPNFVFAYSEYIIAGGENVGIEIKCNGAMIVGTYEVNNRYPAVEAGLELGDVIISVNDNEITSASDLIEEISNITSNNINISFLRDNKTLNTVLNLYKDNNGYKTGIYVKDSITGVGTLTFIDTNTKLFGALGHEILEKNSKEIVIADNGKIFSSIVTSINPSSNGLPGEKNARYDNTLIYGNIFENTIKGVFGNYSSNIKNNNLYKVANPDEIKEGSAKIRTVIDGTNVQEFDIKIKKIIKNQETKNISFTIVDNDLINKTGGIVQGMSGSPIIQDDKIVGAVTHMVIEKPTEGYGIFITNMLIEAEN